MTTSPNLPRPPSHAPYRWLMMILAVVIVGVLLVRYSNPARTPSASALPKYTIVPPFSMTERSGRTITNADLLGKIWVADFIYTTCPGPCPLVTASMAKVQEAVAHDPCVQLVTFTVDPQTDTPGVLAAYADKFGADPGRWWFLTGPEKPLYNLIQNGFYQVVQDNRGQPPAEGQFTVTHSTKMVLVDGDGNVRGFFDGVGSDGRASLLQSIKTVENEENE
jgi:protein SCO1/2